MGLFDIFRKAPKPPVAAESAVAPTWTEGRRVLGQWQQEPYFYPATIRQVAESRCRVQFDDGDQAWLFAFQVCSLDLKVGSRVFARWKAGPHFFPGTIRARDGERLHIHYDDGDQEWTTPAVIRVERPGVGLSPEVMLAEKGIVERIISQTGTNTDPTNDVRLLTGLLDRVADQSVVYYHRGVIHMTLNPDEAILDFDRAANLAVDPSVLAAALSERGGCRARLKQFDRAEADLRRALEIAPGRAATLSELAMLHFTAGRRQAAIEAASQCVALDPGSIVGHMCRAQCLKDLGRFEEAMSDFDRACELHPTSVVAKKLRGVCAYHLRDPDRAIPDLTLAVDAGDNYGLAFRGRMYEQEQLYEKALADFDAALKIDPSQVGIHEDRMRVFQAMNRPDLAAAALRELDRGVLRETEEIAAKGVRMKPGLIMANMVLFDATSVVNSYCRVLISFAPAMTPERLQVLASWLMSFKDTRQTDPVLQYVADLTSAEWATTTRKLVPGQFTDNVPVYTADVYVHRRCLRQGYLNESELWCAAEPDETGRIAMLPVPGCPALEKS